MLALLLFGVFFAMALGGVPLLFSILLATVGVIWGKGFDYPLETIFLSFIGGVEPFILLAVPLFIFAGELLAQGGVGKRIVEFARVLFGWLPGGLGVVTVISCTMFWRGLGLGHRRYGGHWFAGHTCHGGAGIFTWFRGGVAGRGGNHRTADAAVDSVLGLRLHLGRFHAHAVHGRLTSSPGFGSGADHHVHVAW